MPASFIFRGDSYLESERINSLSGAAEIFYLRLMCAADAHGLMDARPSILRVRLYGLRLDRMREADMPRLLAECEKAGLIRLYSVDHKPYLQILRFGQRLRTNPKYPAPPPQLDDTPPQPAATCPHSADNLQQPAAICPQPAATCQQPADNLPQPVSNLPQSADNLPHEIEYEKEIEKEKERESLYDMPRYNTPPAQAPTPSIFRSAEERAAYKTWLSAIKAAHPAGRERATLDSQLHTVAIAAFRSVPTAHQQADLLRAFYDSNLQLSTTGRPFKKPMELRWYLVDLADIIVSARQWAKETRWKPKRPPKSEHGPSVPTSPQPQPQEIATDQDIADFFTDFRSCLREMAESTKPPSDYIQE
ncbi:MAG: hypothetical protein IKZ07_07180 [Akkermansia sp.]|nr:hypothetical protein [Akkermansia sp.]